MMNRIYSILFLCILIVFFSESYGQVILSENNQDETLTEYLSKVAKSNLSYLSEQLNINIAEAELKSAKVFNDPEFSIAYSNNEDWKMEMGTSFETGLSYEINLGNKRRAGINLAKSQYELTCLELDEFFRNLKADASIVYFEALKNKKLVDIEEDSYKIMQKLASADSIRFATGEITKIDAMQSALETNAQMNNFLEARKEFQNSLVTLAEMQGVTKIDSIGIPFSDFDFNDNPFSLSDLISNALESRTELMIAVKSNQISEQNLRLIKAERALDIGIEAGYAHSTIVNNEIAPAPAFNSYSAGISVPLKFSGLNKGAVEAAKYDIEKNKISLHEVEQAISMEVTRAYNDFVSQREKMVHFTKGLTEDAREILDGRTFSYQRGENSLIEVIDAQRTYNELQQEYYNTWFGYKAALVELERVSGKKLVIE